MFEGSITNRVIAMEFAIVFVGIIVVVGLVLAFYFTKKAHKGFIEECTKSDGKTVVPAVTEHRELAVKFEMLPTETHIDENKLVEITNKKVLARVVDAVPEVAQAGVAAANAVQNGAGALYRAVLPTGTKLVDSADMAGAVRGFYRGADGIKGHANLMKVDTSAGVLTNAASSAMSVASVVVGQYYMSQINDQIEKISSSISQISDFQSKEFESRVLALLSQIKTMSEFQVEIVDNTELRQSEIMKLNHLEQECIELLGQANLTISDFLKKVNISYEVYKDVCIDIEKWYAYQKLLTELLYRISDLKYALHLGALSVEHCGALLNAYTEQSVKVSAKLLKWHEMQLGKHGINLELSTRKRVGFDGLIHKVPGLLNDEYNHRAISETVVAAIQEQTDEYRLPTQMEDDHLFEENVTLIVKEGRVYYLPKA